MVKRVISLLMAAVILLSVVPAGALAVETASEQTSVDPGNVSIEGTNSFGTLLSQEISESQAETAEEAASYEAGYTVTDLAIEGTTATVTYNSLEDALLVVALYTEDGMQMLTSAKTTVTADATEAAVEFTGDMPEYFLASAYLVDTYDLSPLCASYDTPMYTREMQELLASTVEDYDADRVLNLDDDDTTNFAVYADTTKIIEARDGCNTVASIDDENAAYIIENADEQITSLAVGDVFVYPYAENEFLIVKVGTITIDGTTVTITGSELAMEDVFCAVKIEESADTEDAVVDTESSDSSITYVGTREFDDLSGYQHAVSETILPNAESDLKRESISVGYAVEGSVRDEDTGVSIKLSGGFNLTVDSILEYYIAWDRQFIRFEVEVSANLVFSVTGKFSKKIPFGKLDFDLIPELVSVGCEPQLSVSFSGTFEWTGKIFFAHGFSYDNEKGGSELYIGPLLEMETEAEAKFEVAVDLRPTLTVKTTDKVILIEASLTCPMGFEVTASRVLPGSDGSISVANAPESKHACENCLEFSISHTFEFGFILEFLNNDWFLVEMPVGNKRTIDLGKAYYSADYDKFDFGECPYKLYRIVVVAENENGERIPDLPVYTSGDEVWGTTDQRGLVEKYVPAGMHFFYATLGDISDYVTIDVERARKILLSLEPPSETPNSYTILDLTKIADTEKEEEDNENEGKKDQSEFADTSGIVESGTCGDDVSWTLNIDGVLTISGTGAMDNYSDTDSNRPQWESYKDQIKQIVIAEGVTSIGKDAFCFYDRTVNVSIADTVTRIEENAFRSCHSLINVHIPDSVISIGNNAFGYCLGLTNVTIGNCVSSIGDYAFEHCSSLEDVVIPDSVTNLGMYAFDGCYSLSAVTIGKRVTTISGGAFYQCRNLTNVTIPDSVINIGSSAFFECGLNSVVIPNSVTSVGMDAFAYCGDLVSVTIGNGVTSISYDAFRECPNLNGIWVNESNHCYSSDTYGVLFDKDKTVLVCAPDAISDTYAIPDSVVSIGDNAFDGCSSLIHLDLSGNVANIGEYAFYCCSSLSDLVIPDSVSSIDNYAFSGCRRLTNVIIPGSVKNIGKNTFANCSGLSSVTIGDGVTSIGECAFYDCISLTDLVIPVSVSSIGNYSFAGCACLTNVIIPASVISIGDGAFIRCSGLTYVAIPDSVTSIGDSAFYKCTSLTDVYYGGTEEQWTQISIGSDNGNLTNATIHYGITDPDVPAKAPVLAVPIFSAEESNAALAVDKLAVGTDRPEPVTPNAVYPGDYSTEVTDSYTLKTASFTGLVPEEQYVLLAMKSLEVEDPLAADNLLFIDQGIALEDGTLTFQYVQREAADTSYVVACGASSKNLENAEITFPKMTADGELQVVDPTVVYDGVTLIEGQDYVIVGTVDYTEAGTYTCYIRGVHNYTGMVECTYTVGGAHESTVTYTSVSISLAGDIGVNYYAQLSDDIVADEDAYMQFTVAGQAQIVPLRDAVVDTDGTYRFTCKVAAKQMTDEITGQMYKSTGPVGEAKVYSVKAYCDAAIPVYSQYAAYADLVALMEAMLNYGGYSQTQFGYNTANLANTGLDTTLPAITAADVDVYTHGATGSESGIGVASVSLLLESTTTIRFYFSLDGSKSIDEYTFYVDGVETTPVESNGQYYVDKVNVAAKDLDEMVTVTVGGLTARYCGMSYVRQVAVLYPNYYSAALVNVAKALYAYNQAANAYFG